MISKFPATAVNLLNRLLVQAGVLTPSWRKLAARVRR